MTSTELDPHSKVSLSAQDSVLGGPDIADIEADIAHQVLRTGESQMVVVTIEGGAHSEGFHDVVLGAAMATRLLGMSELHVVAPAELLPELAVAAAEVADHLPEGFQLCQATPPTHEHPEDATVLEADVVAKLPGAAGEEAGEAAES